MSNLDHYVGRIVRLKQDVFERIAAQHKKHGVLLENSFVVASVRHGVHQLICYGANLRITVRASEVVLV